MKKSGVLIVDGRTDELVTTFGAMRIQGGNIGSSVGEVVYFGQNSLGQQAATGCVADLILQEASLTSLTVVEQYRSGKRGCRKPEQMVLQVREGQMLVNWMNPGKSKPKRSEWVQQFAK